MPSKDPEKGQMLLPEAVYPQHLYGAGPEGEHSSAVSKPCISQGQCQAGENMKKKKGGGAGREERLCRGPLVTFDYRDKFIWKT